MARAGQARGRLRPTARRRSRKVEWRAARDDQGTLVRAVYRGRVAFADWLPGLGLLIIVDHGDGT